MVQKSAPTQTLIARITIGGQRQRPLPHGEITVTVHDAMKNLPHEHQLRHVARSDRPRDGAIVGRTPEIEPTFVPLGIGLGPAQARAKAQASLRRLA